MGLSSKYLNFLELLSHRFYKKARLSENMAARILWSTIPYDSQLKHSNILPSLVYGAKELVKLGSRASIDELYAVVTSVAEYGSKRCPFEESEVKNLELMFKNEEYLKALYILQEIFSRKNWPELYGGKPWKKFVDKLVRLGNTLVEINDAKTNAKWDEYQKKLNEMVAYMNVIDGHLHNSGKVTDKMIDIDLAGRSGKEIMNEIEKVNLLLNSKRLPNPRPVAEIALSNIKSPEKLFPFKDWISEDKHKRSFEPPQKEENVTWELMKVHFQKNELDSKIEYTTKEVERLKRYINDDYYFFDAKENIGNLLSSLAYLIENYLFKLDPKIGHYINLSQVNTFRLIKQHPDADINYIINKLSASLGPFYISSYLTRDDYIKKMEDFIREAKNLFN